jgi:hypothetical protein
VATPIEVTASIDETTDGCGAAPTRGFTMAMSHTVGANGLTVVDIELLPFLSSNPEFVSPRIDNDGADGTPQAGWTLGVIYELSPDVNTPPIDFAFETSTEVVRVSYEAGCADWDAPGTTSLHFANLNLQGSSGIISNQVAVGNLGFEPGIMGSVAITIAPDTDAKVFIRGDSSNNGSINIQDAVLLLNHLFSGTDVDCLDACDMNDDGAVNLVDPVFGLMYTMGLGPVPPSPGDVCGADPTSDNLTCNNSNYCEQVCPNTDP